MYLHVKIMKIHHVLLFVTANLSYTHTHTHTHTCMHTYIYAVTITNRRRHSSHYPHLSKL